MTKPCELEAATNKLLALLRRVGAGNVTADTVRRMMAAHLGLSRRDDLIYVTGTCLYSAIDFVERLAAIIHAEMEAGTLALPDHGKRAAARAAAWKEDD